MFDITEEHFYDKDRMVDVYGLDRKDDPATFYVEWWNAPYQKGGNSEYLGGELYEGEFENR